MYIYVFVFTVLGSSGWPRDLPTDHRQLPDHHTHCGWLHHLEVTKYMLKLMITFDLEVNTVLSLCYLSATNSRYLQKRKNRMRNTIVHLFR